MNRPHDNKFLGEGLTHDDVPRANYSEVLPRDVPAPFLLN